MDRPSGLHKHVIPVNSEVQAQFIGYSTSGPFKCARLLLFTALLLNPNQVYIGRSFSSWLVFSDFQAITSSGSHLRFQGSYQASQSAAGLTRLPASPNCETDFKQEHQKGTKHKRRPAPSQLASQANSLHACALLSLFKTLYTLETNERINNEDHDWVFW